MLRGLTRVERWQAIGWVPIIRITGDVAKMVGYPVGVVWRLRRRKQESSVASPPSVARRQKSD
jgi:hypothetical protein